MKVMACKGCGCSVELTGERKTGEKVSLPVVKCPLCGGKLIEDDPEKYY